MTKNDKKQISDTTIIKNPKSAGYLLQNWKIECNDRKNKGKIQNFIRSTKTNSPSPETGPTNIPPIGNSFMYSEASSNNHGDDVFVSCKRSDIIQFSNITFYYNRFSERNSKAIGRFRIQLLLEDNTWSTRYNILKNDRYNISSTDWTLVNLNFTEAKYGIKIFYDQIDTAASVILQ